MKEIIDIKNIAKETIIQESNAIQNLVNYIDTDFARVVNLIYSTSGRVIVSGIGKSGLVGQKIAATLNSTGTASLFLHAAEAIHGDLGMIQKDDIVIAISKSGNTPEIKVLVPLVKNFGNIIVAITGDKKSYLAKNANYVLNCFVDKEADPNNLAPTCSTTAQIVMGDALAVALLKKRGFSKEDFAKYHPGGALGKRLYLRVKDIYPNNEKPEISPETSLKSAIIEISSKRLGCAAVVENEKVKGIITDGDLRRMMQRNISTFDVNIPVREIMSTNPKCIHEDAFAVEALNIMKDNSITQLLVTDIADKYLGVIHLHDLLQEGII